MSKTGFKTIVSLTAVICMLMYSFAQGAEVSLSSDSGQSITVNGNGFAEVYGLTVQLEFQSAGNAPVPTVEKGSLPGASLMAVNNKIPGRLRIVFVSMAPFASSGSIADIFFASPVSGVKLTEAKGINKDGAMIYVAFPVLPPSSDATKPGEQDRTPEGSVQKESADTTSRRPPGRTTNDPLPNPSSYDRERSERSASGQNPPPNEVPQAKTIPKSVPRSPESKETPSERTASGQTDITGIKKPWDRIDFINSRKPLNEMAVLLLRSPLETVSQEPRVALSDGSMEVRLKISDKGQTDQPGIAIAGGELVSVENQKVTEWIAVVRPDKGIADATVIVQTARGIIEYPLIIVPRMSVMAGDPVFFEGIRKSSGQADSRYDLNGDGMVDNIDAYLYAAATAALP